MTSRGRFIVFEGVEGAGKTTQIAALADWLTARGRSVTVTREPGGTDVGTQIRQILLSPDNRALSHRTELLLYAADRAQHVPIPGGRSKTSGRCALRYACPIGRHADLRYL